MTKKELLELIEVQKGQIDLMRSIIETQREMISVLRSQPFISPDPDDCPMGGKHDFNRHTSGGWVCKCGKTMPHVSFPSTTTT